jgi:hypothetical protein
MKPPQVSLWAAFIACALLLVMVASLVTLAFVLLDEPRFAAPGVAAVLISASGLYWISEQERQRRISVSQTFLSAYAVLKAIGPVRLPIVPWSEAREIDLVLARFAEDDGPSDGPFQSSLANRIFSVVRDDPVEWVALSQYDEGIDRAARYLWTHGRSDLADHLTDLRREYRDELEITQRAYRGLQWAEATLRRLGDVQRSEYLTSRRLAIPDE